MIIMFRVKNFNSFKNDTILDLRKTKYTQHMDHTFKCGNYDLLKTVAIYGANASGKSNLISAITKYNIFILSQLYNDSDKTSLLDTNLRVTAKPFLFTNKIDKKMEYEMVFYNEGYTFQYGYIIEETNILEEWLYVNDEIVFERNNDDLTFGDKYKEALEKYDKAKSDKLYIGVIDYFVTDESIVDIINKFKDFFCYKLHVDIGVFLDIGVKGLGSNNLETKVMGKNEKLRKRVVEFVNKIDVGIKDIIIEKNIDKDSNNIYATHNIYNDNGEIVEAKQFEFDMESSGTIKFISIIEYIIIMLDWGGVFIIDEISSRLHPVITKFIIDLFQSSKTNINNAQLIFTTHDISQMNKEQFRRDEIILVDKDEKGISKTYSLSDLDVRSDASFDKDYLKGKYGALPIIKDFYNSEVTGDAKA